MEIKITRRIILLLFIYIFFRALLSCLAVLDAIDELRYLYIFLLPIFVLIKIIKLKEKILLVFSLLLAPSYTNSKFYLIFVPTFHYFYISEITSWLKKISNIIFNSVLTVINLCAFLENQPCHPAKLQLM